MEPPNKRPRLSQEAYGSIVERKMKHVETSLEVDHMILDYLLYQAINACFSNRNSSISDEAGPVERALLSVDEFRALFQLRYPTYKFDTEIRFRQQLLQLVALFTQRLTRNCATPNKQSLTTLRQTNLLRAQRWIGSASRVPTASLEMDVYNEELPLSHDDLDRNRARVLEALGAPVEDPEYEDAFYGTASSVSLLEILPLFMRVSAFCLQLFPMDTNEKWMGLAAGLMLQACLEQYLVYGQDGLDAIDEAFAWGYKRKTSAGEDGLVDNDEATHLMFEDSEYAEEVQAWSRIRGQALRKLCVPEGAQSLPAHLQSLASEHPAEHTEGSVMSFLQMLTRSIPLPTLAQLETGRLEGMSESETQHFLRGCGLSASEFLAHPV